VHRARRDGDAGDDRAGRAFGGFAALDQRDQKRVFDHFALGVAAANSHHLGGSKLQYLHTFPIIVLGKRMRRTTDVRLTEPAGSPSTFAPRVEINHKLFQSLPVSAMTACIAMWTFTNEFPVL
jgi:hypothetical protein